MKKLLYLALTLCSLSPGLWSCDKTVDYKTILETPELDQKTIQTYVKNRILARFKKRLEEPTSKKLRYIKYIGLHTKTDSSIGITHKPYAAESECSAVKSFIETLMTIGVVLQQKNIPFNKDTMMALEPSFSWLCTITETPNPSKRSAESAKNLLTKLYAITPEDYKKINTTTLAIINHYLDIFEQQFAQAHEYSKKRFCPDINQILPSVSYTDPKNADCAGYYSPYENHICIRPVSKKLADRARVLATIEHEITHFEQHLNDTNHVIFPSKSLNSLPVYEPFAIEVDAEEQSLENIPNPYLYKRVCMQEIDNQIKYPYSMTWHYFSTGKRLDYLQDFCKKQYTKDRNKKVADKDYAIKIGEKFGEKNEKIVSKTERQKRIEEAADDHYNWQCKHYVETGSWRVWQAYSFMDHLEKQGFPLNAQPEKKIIKPVAPKKSSSPLIRPYPHIRNTSRFGGIALAGAALGKLIWG